MIFARPHTGKTKLKAVAADSAQALPAYESDRDGMIGIISAIAPKKVYAGNTAPELPKEGDVWVLTAEKSSAPVQLNLITLYPAKVRQYIGGAWVDVTAYVRAGGEWKGLELWLFETGSGFYAVTGGWADPDGNAIVINSDTNLIVKVPAESYENAAVRTLEKIPAGRYRKLYVQFTKSYVGSVHFGFSQTSDTADYGAYDVGPYRTSDTIAEETLVELDLQTLPADYTGYFKAYLGSAVNPQKDETVTISKVYLTT